MTGWGVGAFLAGLVLVTNVFRAAEWLQLMSYQRRGWPTGVRTCRAIGGVFLLAGAAVLIQSATEALR